MSGHGGCVNGSSDWRVQAWAASLCRRGVEAAWWVAASETGALLQCAGSALATEAGKCRPPVLPSAHTIQQWEYRPHSILHKVARMSLWTTYSLCSFHITAWNSERLHFILIMPSNNQWVIYIPCSPRSSSTQTVTPYSLLFRYFTSFMDDPLFESAEGSGPYSEAQVR